MIAEINDNSNSSNTTKTPSPISQQIEYFTEDQLNTTAIRDLYIDLCKKNFQTPCEGLLKQLPAAPEDVDDVASLDFSRCYFGQKGLHTIFPVIDACHRVVHLNLTGVGLEGGSTMLSLLEVLKNHRAVRELVLSKNRIGTESVLKLCHIAYSRCLLYKIDLEDSWVVEPLRKRLQKILDLNSQQRERFERPGRRFEQKPAFDLINDVPTPPPETEPIDTPIVPQLCRILEQLRNAVLRHKNSMPDLQAMFKPLVPGVCSAKSFMRVVKLLNLDQVENEFSLHELSDVFGTTLFVEGDRVIKYGRILAALRDHCIVAPNTDDGKNGETQQQSEEEKEQTEEDTSSSELIHHQMSVETRDLFDHIFDSRSSILESCEMIDIDATGNLCFEDFVAGIAAATQTGRTETEKFTQMWYDKLSGSSSTTLTSLSSVPYKTLLQSLQLETNLLLPVSAEGWQQWTPKLLRAQT